LLCWGWSRRRAIGVPVASQDLLDITEISVRIHRMARIQRLVVRVNGNLLERAIATDQAGVLAQKRLGGRSAIGNRPLHRVGRHLPLRLRCLLPWLLPLRLLLLLWLQSELLALRNGQRPSEATQPLVDLGGSLEVALVHGVLGMRSQGVHLPRHALDLRVHIGLVVGAAAPLSVLRILDSLIALSGNATSRLLRLRPRPTLGSNLLLQILQPNLGSDLGSNCSRGRSRNRLRLGSLLTCLWFRLSS
jgi:hypothetical protein